MVHTRSVRSITESGAFILWVNAVLNHAARDANVIPRARGMTSQMGEGTLAGYDQATTKKSRLVRASPVLSVANRTWAVPPTPSLS